MNELTHRVMQTKQPAYYVDLDGTLVKQSLNEAWDHTKIGERVELMILRVRKLLESGFIVKIFTSRVAGLYLSDHGEDAHTLAVESKTLIEKWCFETFGRVLPVTAVKDLDAIEIWDNAVRQVITNTGLFKC